MIQKEKQKEKEKKKKEIKISKTEVELEKEIKPPFATAMKVNNQEEFILFADRGGISVLKCLFLLTFFNKCVRGYHFYSIFAK